MTALPAASSAQSQVLCSHCSLPVPPGLIEQDAPEQFCCHGCKTAAAVIRQYNLGKFYTLRNQDPLAQQARPVITPQTRRGSQSLDFLDSPDVIARCVRVMPRASSTDPAATTHRASLLVDGVHCAACVWLIEQLPKMLQGVLSSRLDLSTGRVTTFFDPSRITLRAMGEQLATLGYPPQLDQGEDLAGKLLSRRDLVDLGVAGACAGNVMLLFFALYAGAFEGMSDEHAALLRWSSFLITLVAILWPGRVFFRGAWTALRSGLITLDVPLSLGLGLGLLWGGYNTITGSGELFFDSLAALVFALLIGRTVQRSQQRMAGDMMSRQHRRIPQHAWKISPTGEPQLIQSSLLKPGDLVEVRSGDLIPADGIILSGSSHADQSFLTGESRPISLKVGHQALAGSLNLTAPLRLHITAAGQGTQIAAVLSLVDRALHNRPNILHLTDKLATLFLLLVLATAIIIFVVWWPLDPARAIMLTVALLVANCPCGLGLATPMVMAVSLGRAAKQGILIRRADVVELLAKPAHIYLDKTGTLTQGSLAVESFFTTSTPRRELALTLIRSLETSVNHPAAAALLTFAQSGPTLPTSSITTASQGLTAAVSLTGDTTQHTSQAFIGSLALAHQSSITLPPPLSLETGRLLAAGLSPVIIALDHTAIAIAGLGDPIRPGTRDALTRLMAQGHTLEILSGDHPQVVQRVAHQLGNIPFQGGLTPQQKAIIVQAKQAELLAAHNTRKVLMVGDGVNDAPALARADVGIAAHGGAEASLKAAPIYLGTPGLEALLDLTSGSRRVMHAIHITIAISLIYNVIVAGLCIAGLVTPLWAAIIMPASSLSVTGIALIARTFIKRPSITSSPNPISESPSPTPTSTPAPIGASA
jgi:P-type Cu2+ transporter